MTLTFHIAAELEAKLLEQAKSEGKPPEVIAREALEDRLALSDQSPAMMPRADWKQEFQALLSSMPDGNVNADLDRANVYEGRGA